MTPGGHAEQRGRVWWRPLGPQPQLRSPHLFQPARLPRIERLLTDEFQLRYEYDAKLVCNERDCKTFVNMGCLVVQLQELFRFLSETKPFETYVVTLPDEDN